MQSKKQIKGVGYFPGRLVICYSYIHGNNGDTIMYDISHDFNNRCYELLRLIPEGKVTTYKEMAKALNSKAWRAVGSAMAKNKNLITTPCHRVVRSDGSIGQYALGTDKKHELLTEEGIVISNGKVKDLSTFMYKFSV